MIASCLQRYRCASRRPVDRRIDDLTIHIYFDMIYSSFYLTL